MSYPSFILKFTVVAALLAAAALSAQASVLYFDDFDGDASQPLLGTRPDLSFNAASWSNSSVKSPFNAAGGSLSGDRGGAVWLPISLEPDAVYQLTVTDLEPRSNRVAIGFADTNANSIHYHLRLQARAWLYARIPNAELEMLIGPGVSNKVEQSPEFFCARCVGRWRGGLSNLNRHL